MLNVNFYLCISKFRFPYLKIFFSKLFVEYHLISIGYPIKSYSKYPKKEFKSGVKMTSK